jgi:predicted DCC family thiol-disulfide oxidoreductase YuxK
MGDPVLLYDGDCGLCSAFVRFVLRRDRRGVIRFASMDGTFARDVLSRHPRLRELDTVVWYEPGEEGGPERVLTRSAAVLRVLEYLGGIWNVGRLALPVPRSWLDLLYRMVAQSRRRLFGRPAACLLPPPDARRRFLD